MALIRGVMMRLEVTPVTVSLGMNGTMQQLKTTVKVCNRLTIIILVYSSYKLCPYVTTTQCFHVALGPEITNCY